MAITMGNVGLPGTSGFVGEILTMTGVYGASTWTALFAATGVILSAVYALSLYRRVIFGDIKTPQLAAIADLELREVAIFTPLIIGTLVLGVQPNLVFQVTGPAVDNLIHLWRAGAGL